MKVLVSVCLFTIAVVSVVALPVGEVEIVSQDAMVEHNGKFHYHYVLNDGSKTTSDGVLKHIDADHDGEAIEGHFSFIADDGLEYAVSYTADENGYRPVGAHLPTPPPIPESVLKTLKYLEEHPYNPPQNAKN